MPNPLSVDDEFKPAFLLLVGKKVNPRVLGIVQPMIIAHRAIL